MVGDSPSACQSEGGGKMRKRILVLPMALLMVVMVASPALARGGADVCVS